MDERIIRLKLDQLYRRAVLQRWPITSWQARTADYAAPGDYRYDGNWAALGQEGYWPAGKTVFLRTNVQAPAVPSSSVLYIEFRIDGLEGMLSIGGRPYAGIDSEHPRIALPFAGPLELTAEFNCLPAALHNPELRSERARLRGAALIEVDREALAAWYDLSFAWQTARQAKDERRRLLLADAVEAALLALDLTAPGKEIVREVAESRRVLRERVAAIAPDPEAGRVFLAGHTHIDTAWLWPLRETVRKCGRTFSTACRLMERYPDYHFCCSQAQLYAYTKQYFPALYEEIKDWVATGRWECTGGMWVEPDCNIPNGESLIRQVLHGVRFYQREFGVRPRSCWLPDVFGYPASLPGILKGCGLDNFQTNKLHWQARNPFPAHLFWWEGLDGSRVLASISRLKSYYNGWPNPEELAFAWDNYNQKAAYPEVLFPFGKGDGGGGPNEEMLEFAGRAASYPALPACRQGAEETYFDDVRRADPDLPTWEGELYLETHRGTYTSQGAIKRANRHNELALREAELWSALAAMHGSPVDTAALAPAWENLLLLQFHDILPGSSIAEVYREALADHARIASAAAAVRGQALSALSGRVRAAGDLVAFNSLSWPRSDLAVATVPEPAGPVELLAPDGHALPAQVIARHDGLADLAFAPEALPPLGYAAFRLRPAAAPVEHSLRVSAQEIENRFFRLELDAEGQITRLYDKRCAREVLTPGQVGNRLQLFQDGPERESAWNVHATFEKREYAWEPGATVEVREAGPVRASVRVTRRYRDSVLVQDIILYDRVPRIDFVTVVDWQERQVLLKAAFPVQVRSPRATYEIQFGAVERPTHRNTSWEQEKFEVCAHRWVDLSEPGYGVSLLNDSKYGHDVHGNVLRLTLLRGPEWPDPDADRGRHEFTYSLYPHLGNWDQGETVRRGWELNQPIVCVSAPGKPALAADWPAARSFLGVEGPAVIQALKPAEDGQGWVLRLYEPHGSRGLVTVHAPQPLARVQACNHIEEYQADLTPADDTFTFPIGPFEVKSFRLYLE